MHRVLGLALWCALIGLLGCDDVGKSEGSGLGLPVTTRQLCTTRTSIDCVEDAEITLYSVILQVDQPVSIAHSFSK